MKVLHAILAVLLISAACSPLKTSPNDERVQLELTVHELQTSFDDLRHDINCFQTELQILDGRIKYNENTLASLKSQELEKQQARIEQLVIEFQNLEKKWSAQEKNRERTAQDCHQLASHAHETTAALGQCKSRIEELEQQLVAGQRRFEELSKLKSNIELLAKSLSHQDLYRTYKVRLGDTLEKIAKSHKTEVGKIKQLNQLEQDLIMVGQELKIPPES